ncbi:MAG: arginine--tRNA ligase, partial [Nanoarchaeota archaeon]
DQSDAPINALYKVGRKLSLDYFETIYQRLGTKFDFYFFESESGPVGRQLVNEHLDAKLPNGSLASPASIFEKSDGAIIFRGEKYGLHTRVFLTKENLPTYEAKELGLAKIKFDRYPYDESIVITGNEINAYFGVLLKALELVYPDLASKTKHVGHGMLRLPTGKMSSRVGNVITAEQLLTEVKTNIERKMSDRNFSAPGREATMEAVALGAIKYSILRPAPGRDVIFDLNQSISFEGDSGPYLQYTLVRARAVLEKAAAAGIQAEFEKEIEPTGALEHRLIHFGATAARAASDFAPHRLVNYLTELSSLFNSYYALTKIIEPENPQTSYRVALTAAVAQVLTNGL